MADVESSTQDENNDALPESHQGKQPEFKKPVLIGRIGKLPKKAKTNSEKASEENAEEKPREIQINIQTSKDSSSKSSLPPAVLLKELSTPIPYKEPKWSGVCPDGSGYALEVLKSGCIVERIDLTTKPYYVFGRLANCDVVLAHPTISRHHAVLQYKAQCSGEEEQPAGWYVFELGSTHGSQLNRCALRAHHYARVRVGHHLRFGNSTRTYVMLGPEFDCEGESELTVSEIKARAEVMRAERDRVIQEAKEQRERNRLEEEKKRDEQGIDWGMGEDAEEEPDLSVNPFAVTANEELYLADPKKTLRGYFEREGLELAYHCDERAHGQYLCRVELPLDDARGRPVVAEAVHAGKKKEAVVACALEACRLLDRAGLLRQAHHEGRGRRARDWAADEYYDSDEDSFLDRTGSIERKRSRRMRAHRPPDKARTYADLVNSIQELESKLAAEERTLCGLRAAAGRPAGAGAGAEPADDLDAYMASLAGAGAAAGKADKALISSTKLKIASLRAELASTQRLADIARPPHLPPLRTHAGTCSDTHKTPDTHNNMPVKVNNSVIYGRRIKLKEDEKRPKPKAEIKKEDDEFVEEVDSDEEMTEAPRIKEENYKPDKREYNKGHAESQKEVKINEDPDKAEIETQKSQQKNETEEKKKKVYGPMRPPDDYVIPEDYFDQESDRDRPEIGDEH